MNTSRADRAVCYERCELKYIITEQMASFVRKYCREHLPPDPHCRSRNSSEYPVFSLYLDSPHRTLLRDTVEKRPTRFKLRVRTYRGQQRPRSALPAFCEIKRRYYGVVRKTRGYVPQEQATKLLWPRCQLLYRPDEVPACLYGPASEFVEAQRRVGARPIVCVFYYREAYEGVSGERLRVTLDRELQCGILRGQADPEPRYWWPVNPGGVILEVKFTRAYPFWVADMLHRLEVTRRGVCKYALCSSVADTTPAYRGTA